MRGLALPIALVALLAGCGGGDEKTSERSVTVKPNAVLKMDADEYSFDPGRVIVTGAGEVTFRLRNVGSLAHNLRVERDGEDVGGTPAFPGGRTEDARVRLESGAYTLVCTVGDHEDLGMTAKLEVR